MRLQTSPLSAGGDQFLEAFCFSTDAVGDAVYIMGDKVGGRHQVTKTDINDVTHAPAIGLIIFKETSTTCVVQVGGVLNGVYTGLTPQAPQFVGLDSKLHETPPAAPTTGRRSIQMLAQAISSEDLLISARSPIIRVAA